MRLRLRWIKALSDHAQHILLHRLACASRCMHMTIQQVQVCQADYSCKTSRCVQECGTDALRFALCAYTAQGRDINLDIKRVVAYRHWCNKLWNAIKFAMQYLGPPFAPQADPRSHLNSNGSGGAPFACRWILSRLTSVATSVNAALDAYDFATTTQAIYAYWQYDVCDTFIELVKPAMRVRSTLLAFAFASTWVLVSVHSSRLRYGCAAPRCPQNDLMRGMAWCVPKLSGVLLRRQASRKLVPLACADTSCGCHAIIDHVVGQVLLYSGRACAASSLLGAPLMHAVAHVSPACDAHSSASVTCQVPFLCVLQDDTFRLDQSIRCKRTRAGDDHHVDKHISDSV